MRKSQEILIEEQTILPPLPDNAPIPFLQLSQDVDVLNRTVYLADIDIYTPIYIKQRANAIYQTSNDFTTPITLHIGCYGGDVHGMFGLRDVIKLLPTKVNTLGVGTIQSAATLILACGTGTRSITEYSSVMIHQIQSWLTGQTADIETEVKYTKTLQNNYFKLLEKVSKKSAAFWKKQSSLSLTYFSAEKALEYGLVDEIL